MSDEKKIEEPEVLSKEKIDAIKDDPVTLEKIKELLTNNLKWSQIIYEQNRKINRKLFWASFFDYLKIALIVIPLVVGFFYLLPGINNLLNAADIFSGGKDGTSEQGASLDAFLNQLPLDQAKKEQIKTLLR